MARTNGGKTDGRRSSRASVSARCFTVLAALVVIALVGASPLLAMVLLVDILGKSLSGSLDALFGILFGGMLDTVVAVLWWTAWAIWPMLRFAWGQVGWLLLTILGWLLFGDLP
jgi:hypothetical protein